MNDDGNDGHAEDALQFYLWHLEAIGVLDPARRGAPSDLWLDEMPPIRVAIIDSGCAGTHPNLPPGAIDAPMDFAVSSDGVVYGTEEGSRTDPQRATLADKLAALFDGDVDPRVAAIRQRADAFAQAPLTVKAVTDPGALFAGHGTSCAGLVAARTVRTANPPSPGGYVPYFGVNPHAVVIPIATPYSQEIAPLIAAVFHAIAHDADVILMPRGVNDRWKTSDVAPPGPDLRGSRFDQDPDIARDKIQFEYLLRAVSTAVPVVVAAGNDGRAVPAYPASLVEAGESAAHDLIVVGAMNHRGYRSAFSSGSYATGVTAYAPGDDQEVVQTGLLRVGTDSVRGRRLYGSILRGTTMQNLYSPFGVLAIDAPARAAGLTEVDDGADPATFPAAWLYTAFGGTSAACSLVAGVVSLMQAGAVMAQGRRLSGHALKAILLANRPPEPGLADDGTPPVFLDTARLVAAAGAQRVQNEGPRPPTG